MLDRAPGSRISALVVWEPVILSDVGMPTSSTLSLVSDRRATQFWDENRALSQFLVRAAIEDPSLLAEGESVDPDMIVWDFVAVFPPGAVWGDHPRPSYYGGPVVDVMEKVRSALPSPAP